MITGQEAPINPKRFLRNQEYIFYKNRAINMVQPDRISLQEAISALRTDLIESVVASQHEHLRFEVGEITIEFQLEVERNAEAKGGIKFWVIELETGITTTSKSTHKVVVPLKPIRADGMPILTGSDEVPK